MTRLFYDGSCGLCCGAVRLVARLDPAGRIRFAPLGGATFQRLISDARAKNLPDSLVVLTSTGEVLLRSQAVIHLLRGMGPGWRCLGACLTGIPRFFLDGAYRMIAGFRNIRSTCSTYEGQSNDRFDP